MVKNVEANLLGREVSLSFSGSWTSFATVVTRLLVGWMFLYAGLEKLANLWYGPASAFNAGGWLSFGTAGAPGWLHGFLVWAAQTPWMLSFTNLAIPVGEMAIGIGLVLGLMTRAAAFFGGFLLFFFYVGGAGFSSGYVNEQLLAVVALMWVIIMGAGRVWGVDGAIERTQYFQNHQWARYLFG